MLSYFGGSNNAKRNYLHYINEGIDQGRRAELAGGGLIRSMGGWSAVLAGRRRGEREIADQRILGDGDFRAGLEELYSCLSGRVALN